MKGEWQRMRLLACINVQPHLSSGARLTPERLLPLPWDNEPAPDTAAPDTLTPEEQRARMAALVQQLGDKLAT